MPDDVKIPPKIDIFEPLTANKIEGALTINRGENRNYRYRYISGDPPSYAFLMTWKAVGDDPPLTETTPVPTAIFTPEKPLPGLDWQYGVVNIAFPDNALYDTIIGTIWICQRDRPNIPSRIQRIYEKTVSHARDRSTPDQELYLDGETLEFFALSSIEIDLTEYTNGNPKIISKPDFLSLDGTFLIGKMPSDEEDEVYEIKIESQLSKVATRSLYLRRISEDS